MGTKAEAARVMHEARMPAPSGLPEPTCSILQYRAQARGFQGSRHLQQFEVMVTPFQPQLGMLR